MAMLGTVPSIAGAQLQEGQDTPTLSALRALAKAGVSTKSAKAAIIGLLKVVGMPSFDVNVQQDLHEFLVKLVKNMGHEMSPAVSAEVLVDLRTTMWGTLDTLDRVEHSETVVDLVGPICANPDWEAMGSARISLQSVLDGLSVPEQVEWRPDTYTENVLAEKSVRYDPIGQCMLVTITRQRSDGTKVFNAVDMTEHVNVKNERFLVRAAAYHAGQNGAGHYAAIIRNVNGLWFLAEDGRVSSWPHGISMAAIQGELVAVLLERCAASARPDVNAPTQPDGPFVRPQAGPGCAAERPDATAAQLNAAASLPVQLAVTGTRPDAAAALSGRLEASTARPDTATAPSARKRRAATDVDVAVLVPVQLAVTGTRPDAAAALSGRLEASTARPDTATAQSARKRRGATDVVAVASLPVQLAVTATAVPAVRRSITDKNATAVPPAQSSAAPVWPDAAPARPATAPARPAGTVALAPARPAGTVALSARTVRAAARASAASQSSGAMQPDHVSAAAAADKLGSDDPIIFSSFHGQSSADDALEHCYDWEAEHKQIKISLSNGLLGYPIRTAGAAGRLSDKAIGDIRDDLIRRTLSFDAWVERNTLVDWLDRFLQPEVQLVAFGTETLIKVRTSYPCTLPHQPSSITNNRPRIPRRASNPTAKCAITVPYRTCKLMWRNS